MSKSALSRLESNGIPYLDEALRGLGVEVGSWPAPDAAIVGRVLRWWERHPLDRVTLCLHERPELVAGPADTIARAIHRLSLRFPLVPVGATADLFLLPPELCRHIAVWCFATLTKNAGACFWHPVLGPVRVGDGPALSLPEGVMRNALPIPLPLTCTSGLRIPQPRDLISATGSTPALAAAARAADLAGPDAACGAGRRVLRPPWRVLSLDDSELDVEEWDPNDPSLGGVLEPDSPIAVPPHIGEGRRERREWLGI